LRNVGRLETKFPSKPDGFSSPSSSSIGFWRNREESCAGTKSSSSLPAAAVTLYPDVDALFEDDERCLKVAVLNSFFF
jgi:hypothetical protein